MQYKHLITDPWQISFFNKNRSKFSGDGGYAAVFGPGYNCANLRQSVGDDCETVNDIAYQMDRPSEFERQYSFVVVLKSAYA